MNDPWLSRVEICCSCPLPVSSLLLPARRSLRSLRSEQHSLQTWWSSEQILELNHFKWFVIRLDHERFPVQIRVKAFTSVHKRSQAFTSARSSRSMLTYLDSVSVSDLLANATGCESCMRTASSPFYEMSTWSTLSLLRSKYAMVVVLHINVLIVENAMSCCSNHAYSVSCLRSSRRIAE